jgi:hypothetical protein
MVFKQVRIKHGENYQKRISESGRSSSIRKLVSTLNGEIQQVNEEYSKKYNWGNPGKLEESKETASIRESFGIDLQRRLDSHYKPRVHGIRQ